MLLFVLVNATLLPFVWGDLSLRDSATVQSIYGTGSRMPAPAIQPVYRDFDAGASAWQSEPWFVLEHNVIFNEHVAPLWNPFSGFGAPLAANMQSQPFSPFAWFAVVQTSPRFYDLFVLVRFYAAGLFALLFLRLFVSFWPALVGAASFMYAGYFWLYVTMPEISVEVALPAILYCTERVMRRPSAARAGLLALALGLGGLGGMPESLLLESAMVAAYAIYRLAGEAQLRGSFLKSVAAIAVASALGAGISAIQLAPFFEYFPQSFNAHSGTFTGLANDPWSPLTLSTYLSPLMLGPPWNDILTNFHGATGTRGFFGVTASFLAILAIVARVRDGLLRRPSQLPVMFFAGVVVFCLSKRVGVPAANWLGSLPGFRLVNFPKYEEAELACAVAALAAFGAATLLERKPPALAVLLAAVIPLAYLQFVFAAYGDQAASLPNYQWYFPNALLGSLGFLGLVMLLAFWNVAREGRAARVGIGLVALLVAEVHCSYVVPMFYVIEGEPRQSSDVLDGAPYISFVRAHLRRGERFLGRDNLLFPNWSAAFGIHDVRALDAIYERHYLTFAHAFLAPAAGELQDRFTGTERVDYGRPLTRRFLQMSSIRFIASSSPLPSGPREPAGPFRQVFSQPGVAVLEFTQPLPRISIYQHALVARDDDAALSAITSPPFDSTREVVVQQAQAGDGSLTALEHAASRPVIAGTLTRDESRTVEVSFATPSSAIAVLNDTYYPGWEARVDGRKAPILRSNYLFRGVLVGPGRHVVTFTYEPQSYALGRDMAVVSILIVLAMLIVKRKLS